MKSVNLNELSDAFQGLPDDDTYRSFVDKRDGQIYSFEARHLAIAGFYLDGDDYEIYPTEQSEIDKAREFTDHYDRELVVAFPDKYEIRDYDIMEEYSESQPDARIANQLLNAIHGKGAFRKFKEAVPRFGFLDDWYAYRESAMLERTRRWCVRNGIDYTPKIAFMADMISAPRPVRIYRESTKYTTMPAGIWSAAAPRRNGAAAIRGLIYCRLTLKNNNCSYYRRTESFAAFSRSL